MHVSIVFAKLGNDLTTCLLPPTPAWNTDMQPAPTAPTRVFCRLECQARTDDRGPVVTEPLPSADKHHTSARKLTQNRNEKISPSEYKKKKLKI